jgi:hypothetical protein
LWRNWWNGDWQWKPKFSEKNCPSATFVHHKIPHDQTRFLNPGRRGGKPATNRLSYGAAFTACYKDNFTFFHLSIRAVFIFLGFFFLYQYLCPDERIFNETGVTAVENSAASVIKSW